MLMDSIISDFNPSNPFANKSSNVLMESLGELKVEISLDVTTLKLISILHCLTNKTYQLYSFSLYSECLRAKATDSSVINVCII